MPRLPSARDVQTVSPRIGSDPGVDAPSAAFESPVGTLAQELAPAAEVLARVALKQENRRDTVDRSARINQYTREADLELSRLNTEADLSTEEALSGYGSFLAERRKKSIEEHAGSKDSIASLTMRLQDVEADAIGRAAGISTKLGREKVKTTFSNALSPLIQSAAQSPTLENIDQQFINLETQVGDIRAALDPAEEESFRQIGREQIVLSAVDTLIIRGRVETAESLLEDGGLIQSLSADKQREVRRKIETVAAARDGVLREITQAEAILGRPLTQEEKLIKLGLASKQALTERQRRTEELMARGLSPELSQDIAANDIKVVGPDPFGNFYSVNVATNESRLVVGEDAEKISNIMAEVKPKTEPKPTKLEEAVTKGTGPFASIQSGISNVIGPFIEGTVFEDTTDARQSVRLFTQTAKTGLINNPRFPVAEQNIVKELLPDPDKFFVDPDRARSDLNKLKEFLTDSKESKTNELGREKITTERRGELTDQISRIDELLSLMETPAEGGNPVINTQEEVDQLESGERFIWGPTGEEFVKE